MTTYYKIRSKKNPEMYLAKPDKWNKSGKVYDKIGKLRAFLTIYIDTYDYTDWEIVEYEVIEKPARNVHELLTDKALMKLLKK